MIAVALPFNPHDVTTSAQAQLLLDEIARQTDSPGRSVRRISGGRWLISGLVTSRRVFVDALDDAFPNHIFGWPDDDERPEQG